MARLLPHHPPCRVTEIKRKKEKRERSEFPIYGILTPVHFLAAGDKMDWIGKIWSNPTNFFFHLTQLSMYTKLFYNFNQLCSSLFAALRKSLLW